MLIVVETKADFPVLVRFPIELIRRLEAYRGKKDVIPPRSIVIRAALDEYLRERGV